MPYYKLLPENNTAFSERSCTSFKFCSDVHFPDTSSHSPINLSSSAPGSFAQHKQFTSEESKRNPKVSRGESVIEKALFGSATTFMAPSCESLVNLPAAHSSPYTHLRDPIESAQVSHEKPRCPAKYDPATDKPPKHPKLSHGTSAIEKAILKSATTFMAPSCDSLLNCESSTSVAFRNSNMPVINSNNNISAAMSTFKRHCSVNSFSDMSSPSTSSHERLSTPDKIPHSGSSLCFLFEEESSASSRPAVVAKQTSLIEQTLQSYVGTLISPRGGPISKLDSNPTDLLRAVRERLRFTLINTLGLSKANNLYRNHVQQTHFLIVHADEAADREMGARIRAILEDCSNSLRVNGTWSITLGTQRLAVWQKLIESSTTILVIMSRALCRDKVLALVFPEVLIKDQAVVPLFLEPFTNEDVNKEIPSQLRLIVYKFGVALYSDKSNIEDYIKNLHLSFDYSSHYEQEIKALESLLQNYRNDPGYICPCGSC